MQPFHADLQVFLPYPNRDPNPNLDLKLGRKVTTAAVSCVRV